MGYIFYNDFDIKPAQYPSLNWSGANGFCFDSEGNVCIVWEEEKKFWTLPGGGKEKDESPQETFEREVREETQSEAVAITYFHAVYAKCFDENNNEIPVKENAIVFRYICRLEHISPFQPIQNNTRVTEIDERRFVSLEEVPDYLTWLKDTENGRESLNTLRVILSHKIREPGSRMGYVQRSNTNNTRIV